MTLQLKRIVLFVEDLDRQTRCYGDVLGLAAHDLRDGWSEFAAGACTIALHRGKGRRPRLEFACDGALEQARELLIARGAKLGKIESLRGGRFCRGKDGDGNQIQLSEKAGGDEATG